MPPEAPTLTSLRDALVRFAFPDSSVQTSRHILALHWYVACRLVIEGGFDPDRIRPRPPIAVERTRSGIFLHHDPGAAKSGERTILGGLKTKRLDVTVTVPTVGPALAVSLKGSHNAFRNLTNRMETRRGRGRRYRIRPGERAVHEEVAMAVYDALWLVVVAPQLKLGVLKP